MTHPPESAGATSAPAVAGWHSDWLAALPHRAATLWRGVEAQHRVATMKLIDTLDEQALLEALLESSKPPLPAEAHAVPAPHYLAFTPFRYVSPWPSRFRAGHEPGVWYGAERLATACAEVGYWRWRFVVDSDGLRGESVLTEHTFFEARVDGRAVDLTAPPWDAARALWMHPTDHGACHALAAAARAVAADWIRYRSVRDPGYGACGAVLAVSALTIGDLTRQQTWACKASAEAVLMRPLGQASGEPPLAFAFGPA